MTIPPPQSRPKLGRLVRLDPREVWKIESVDFTPWLAQEENIALLGDVIGLDLEVESTEKGVGPFRADILCKNTVDGHWVLIENQLERTDHVHLGQLLTYAAGLDAGTVVWVARQFTEEHRAALDWLNQITDGRFAFFGLEVELWRIGDSPPAPKFNVVSQPNDWSKAVKETAGGQGGAPSPTKQLYLDFWTQFKAFMEERGSPLKVPKPSTHQWKDMGIGRSGFVLAASNNVSDNWSAVTLWISGPEKQAHFHLLHAQKDAIERKLGLGPLEWRELPTHKQSQIGLRRRSTPRDRTTWPELDRWFADTLERMRDVFGPIVKMLDAAAYVPHETGPLAPEVADGDNG